MKNISIKMAAAGMGLALTIVNSGVAWAQVPASGSAGTARVSVVEQRVDKLKTKANAEITRRLTTLNNLLTRIQASTRLSVVDKTTLTTEIQSEITNMTDLKTKIDGDSDIATLRTDVKAIVNDYHVYAFVMPQVGLMIAADSISMIADRMAAISIKLGQALAGYPDPKAQAALTDLNTQISDARALVLGVQTTVLPLTPAGNQASNRAALQASRAKLNNARDDLKKGRVDIETILKALKTTPASSSATGSSGLR